MNKQTVSPSGKNRGIVYIILMVLFTLVMIADLVILALVPATGTRNFPNFDPSSNPFFNGGGEAPGGQFPMPSGGDPGGFSPPGGQLPEGFTLPSGISPPTNEEFEMPEGFTLPEGGFNFPGGNTGGRPPSGGRPFGSGNSFLSFVRRAWLPILIVCLLGDGICLFLYIRLRRKKSAETQQSLAESEEGSEDDADDKKKKKGGWILPLCLVLAVAVVIASLPLGDSDTKAVSANEQVISDTAEKGTILTVLSGTGTLTDEAAELVSIPVSVGITAYHVNNGDTVAAGDVLASVDKASVGVAIAELQTVIDELDKDLDVASDESADAAITAAVGGRVKLIYAREDESVADTVSEHGCLMLLSLDGLMAVDLENADGISVGDTVKVAFSDGTEESGRAAAKEDGILTVTISDESASCGDVVSVWKEDEQQLGEGSLYIHSELRITGYYGNISSVPVEVNTLVDEGDTLLELSDVGRTSAYENLLNRRKQLEDQMASLFRLYRDGYIRAESSGIVSGISADSTVVSLSAKSNKKETNLAGSGVVKTSAVTQSRTVSLMRLTTLSYQKTSQVKMLSGLQQPVNPPQPTGSQKPSDPPAPTGSQEPSNPPQPTGSQKPSDPPAPTGSQEPSNPPQPTGSQESTGPTQPTGPQEPTGPTQPTGPQEPTGPTQPTGPQEPTGPTQPTDPQEPTDPTQPTGPQEPTDPTQSTGPQEPTGPTQPTGPQEPTGPTQPTGPQEPTGPTQPTGPQEPTEPTQPTGPQEPTGPTQPTGPQEPTGPTQPTGPQEPTGPTQPTGPQEPTGPQQPTGPQEPTGPPQPTGSQEPSNPPQPTSSQEPTGPAQPTGSQKPFDPGASSFPSQGSSGSFPSGSATSPSFSGGANESPQEEKTKTYEQYSLAEKQVLSITPQESMSITISVDELDILSIREDLSVKITLEAMKGQEFTGTITEIGRIGTNEGGNTKYSLTVSLPKEKNLIAGMNAAVKIITAEREATITIPVAALVESNGKTYVYTSHDEQTDTLGDLVEVKTGASDGTIVEILSGIENGSSVFYRYADTLIYNFFTAIGR